METVTVTYGRNVGDLPMDLERWNDFNWAMRNTVESYTAELWADGQSRNAWKGVPEESRVLYGPVRTGANLTQLRARLANLATQFGQEAIGLSVGQSELVESYGEAEVRTPAFIG